MIYGMCWIYLKIICGMCWIYLKMIYGIVSDLLENYVLISFEVWLSKRCYRDTFAERARKVNIVNKDVLKN